MSAFLWSNPVQPHPIPPEWGDPRNFQWMPAIKRHWCKLCGKYADDGHIQSQTHAYRKKHPDIYLWYLNENSQPPHENLSAVPHPPLGPPPDYRSENDPMHTQRPPRGYMVGVPAPPRGPPPALDAAFDRSLQRQTCNGSVELMYPIPQDWGDPGNFQWMPVNNNYLCKLCGKYADDKHINSRTHTHRQKYPDIYLWYLNENSQHEQAKMLVLPPPPPGSPRDYRSENDSIRTQRPPRGYKVGVPAPPRGPPLALDTAADRSRQRQRTCHHLLDSGARGSYTRSTYVIDEWPQATAALYHAGALRSSDARAGALKLEFDEHADPNHSFGEIPIGIERGVELQLPPVPALCNGAGTSTPAATCTSVERLYPDTKTTRGIVENETKSYVSDDPDSIVSNRWHRYAVDDTRATYWWWNQVHHHICFREDTPGEWCKYSDQATGKSYWYLSNEIWFWENTGNTTC